MCMHVRACVLVCVLEREIDCSVRLCVRARACVYVCARECICGRVVRVYLLCVCLHACVAGTTVCATLLQLKQMKRAHIPVSFFSYSF